LHRLIPLLSLRQTIVTIALFTHSIFINNRNSPHHNSSKKGQEKNLISCFKNEKMKGKKEKRKTETEMKKSSARF